jgi:hypothetical protein
MRLSLLGWLRLVSPNAASSRVRSDRGDEVGAWLPSSRLLGSHGVGTPRIDFIHGGDERLCLREGAEVCDHRLLIRMKAGCCDPEALGAIGRDYVWHAATTAWRLSGCGPSCVERNSAAFKLTHYRKTRNDPEAAAFDFGTKRPGERIWTRTG